MLWLIAFINHRQQQLQLFVLLLTCGRYCLFLYSFQSFAYQLFQNMNTLVHAASSSYDLYLERNPSILTRNISFWIPFSHRTIKTIMHVSLYPEQPIYCRLPLLRINLAKVMLLDIYLSKIKNIELKYGRLVFSLSFSSSLALHYHIQSPSAGLSLFFFRFSLQLSLFLYLPSFPTSLLLLSHSPQRSYSPFTWRKKSR